MAKAKTPRETGQRKKTFKKNAFNGTDRHMTDIHYNLETELPQWADSKKVLISEKRIQVTPNLFENLNYDFPLKNEH